MNDLDRLLKEEREVMQQWQRASEEHHAKVKAKEFPSSQERKASSDLLRKYYEAWLECRLAFVKACQEADVNWLDYASRT